MMLAPPLLAACVLLAPPEGAGPSAETIAGWVARLNAPSHELREEATERLKSVGADVVAPLLASPELDREEVRWRAAEILESVGWPTEAMLDAARGAGPGAVPFLVDVLQDGRFDLAEASGRALAAVAPEEGLAALREVADGGGVRVRYCVARALGAFDPEMALPVLGALLAEGEGPVQYAAAGGMARLGEGGALSDLMREEHDRIGEKGTAIVGGYNLACLYALAGQPDEAFAWLERAVTDGYADYVWARRDPDLVLLHGDPRFDMLLRRMAERVAEGEGSIEEEFREKEPPDEPPPEEEPEGD